MILQHLLFQHLKHLLDRNSNTCRVIAAIIPAIRASRQNILDSISYERINLIDLRTTTTRGCPPPGGCTTRVSTTRVSTTRGLHLPGSPPPGVCSTLVSTRRLPWVSTRGCPSGLHQNLPQEHSTRRSTSSSISTGWITWIAMQSTPPSVTTITPRTPHSGEPA